MKKFGVVLLVEEYYEVYAEDEQEASEVIKNSVDGKLIDKENQSIKEVFEIK